MEDNLKLNLNKVTIVSINGRDPENSAKAIKISSEKINFYQKIIITNKNLSYSDIEVIKIDGLASLKDYNIFCIKEMYKYIDSEYCLFVQPDGFVVNPYLWTDFFYNYDYIGAPWGEHLTKDVLQKTNMQGDVKNIVGNGGFSLRSKKLLIETSKIDYKNPELEEDVIISVLHRKDLKQAGIKYAPVQIAQQFSLESYINEKSILGNSFGFHGSTKYFPYFTEYEKLINETDYV
jgi:hypothetical protein